MYNNCVVDLLEFMRDHGCYYVYTNEYRRITGDNEVKVKGINFYVEGEEIASKINSLVINRDSLNVSVRNKIEGYVELPEQDAMRYGLPEKLDVVRYRTHTLVAYGLVNVDELEFYIPSEYVPKFKSLGFDYEIVKGMWDKLHVRVKVRDLDVFGELESTKKSSLYAYELIEKIDKLKMAEKVLKEVVYERGLTKPYESEFTEDQEMYLNTLGIRNGVYDGVRDYDKEYDKEYKVHTLRLYRKGSSALPSFNKMKKDIEAGKGNANVKYMYKLYNALRYCEEGVLDTVEDKISNIDKYELDLLRVRYYIANNFDEMQDLLTSCGVVAKKGVRTIGI